MLNFICFVAVVVLKLHISLCNIMVGCTMNLYVVLE